MKNLEFFFFFLNLWKKKKISLKCFLGFKLAEISLVNTSKLSSTINFFVTIQTKYHTFTRFKPTNPQRHNLHYGKALDIPPNLNHSRGWWRTDGCSAKTSFHLKRRKYVILRRDKERGRITSTYLDVKASIRKRMSFSTNTL